MSEQKSWGLGERRPASEQPPNSWTTKQEFAPSAPQPFGFSQLLWSCSMKEQFKADIVESIGR